MNKKPVFDSIPDALEDIANGKMVIVLDDEDRENEGDFVMAADKITPEAVNFMATHGRGLICTPITQAWAKKLSLAPMSSRNSSAYDTPFTISIDARENTTTGISSQDRYHTILKLSEPIANADDFAQPGHIFPLIAKDAGVLERPGHTEAGVDLARLAGCQPVSVICEIMNEDGTMSRRDDLFAIAKTFDLKIITIKDLIRYRRIMENGFKLETTIPFPNKYAQDFELSLFVDTFTGQEYTAITRNLETGSQPLVRVHSQCFTGDLFGSMRCDCGDQLDQAMKDISESDSGVLIYLEQEGRGIGLANKIRAYKLQDQGFDTIEANHKLGFGTDLRDFTSAAMILNTLNISKIRLTTNNPDKIAQLQSYGIQVTKTVHVEPKVNPINKDYLLTKKMRMGHKINISPTIQ